MKIFITGATGFIGSHLCHRLHAAGHELHVLVRSPKKLGKLPDSVHVVKGDLSIFGDEDLVLPDFDIVIHLAGLIAAKVQQEYFQVNFETVRDMVEFFEKQEKPLKRFLFASSLAAAGPSEGVTPLEESMPMNPVDNYGLSKKMAEDFLDGCSLKVTSFRPAIVLGPGDENSLTLYQMAKRGIAIRIPGQDQVVSFVDIDDLVDSIVLMMGDEREGQQRFFVAHDTPIVISGLWDLLGKQFGKKVFLVPVPKFALFGIMKVATLFTRIFGLYNQLDEKQYKQLTTPAFVCSGKKLQRELGWNPQYDLEASVKKAIIGYKKQGLL